MESKPDVRHLYCCFFIRSQVSSSLLSSGCRRSARPSSLGGCITGKSANGPNLKPNGKFQVSVEDRRQRDVSSGPQWLAEGGLTLEKDFKAWTSSVWCVTEHFSFCQKMLTERSSDYVLSACGSVARYTPWHPRMLSVPCEVPSPSYTVALCHKYIYSSDALLVLILKLDLSGNVLTSDGCGLSCLTCELNVKMSWGPKIVGCLQQEEKLWFWGFSERHWTNHKHFFQWQKKKELYVSNQLSTKRVHKDAKCAYKSRGGALCN